MRQIIFAFTLLLCSLLAMQANAQTKTSLGVKLNGNMTNLRLMNMKDRNNHFEPGANLGGFAKIEFGKSFALQPELMMSYTEGEIKVGNEKSKYEYSAVEVPVYAIGQFKAGNGQFFFGLAPLVGYGFDSNEAKVKIGNAELPNLDDFWKVDSDNYAKLGLNHWYYGGALIVGYELQNGLTFQAGYQRTHDFRSDSKKRSKIETHTINLGIGYKF
ncbi:PorT family protein [Bacteroides sp. 214]|uniref:porin family protein n=1 Tax=Bacteroides sp. 214 TaxID=2302935 RepID=UPI0013D694D6|nr:porin family protein [Bacteroides sp. 214]NDW12218.1 PorT family protein [Bacteroides sp. 214]